MMSFPVHEHERPADMQILQFITDAERMDVHLVTLIVLRSSIFNTVYFSFFISLLVLLYLWQKKKKKISSFNLQKNTS